MKNTKDEIFAFGVGFPGLDVYEAAAYYHIGIYETKMRSKKWYVLTFLVGVLGGVVLTLVLR